MKSRVWNSIKYYASGIYNYVDEDHCFLLAAGIAFNVLYCILPLLLVVFYFFSAALTGEKAIESVVNYITVSFPVPVYEADLRAWLTKELATLGHESNIVGLIGGISLFFLGSILFSTLRTSLNAVLNMTPKANLIYQKLLDFLLMIVILVLLLFSSFLSPIINLLQHLGTTILPGWLAYILDTAVPWFVSLGISILLYVVLFRMLPHERLSRKMIFVSATTTVVLTEAMRLLFVYYMGHLSSIGTLYGTYAFVVGISLWVYYASLAFLIGAEVGWLYKERNEITIELQLTEEEKAHAKNPGSAAIDESMLEHYEHLKHNPARPAGEIKPPPA